MYQCSINPLWWSCYFFGLWGDIIMTSWILKIYSVCFNFCSYCSVWSSKLPIFASRSLLCASSCVLFIKAKSLVTSLLSHKKQCPRYGIIHFPKEPWFLSEGTICSIFRSDSGRYGHLWLSTCQYIWRLSVYKATKNVFF